VDGRQTNPLVGLLVKLFKAGRVYWNKDNAREYGQTHNAEVANEEYGSTTTQESKRLLASSKRNAFSGANLICQTIRTLFTFGKTPPWF